MTSIHDSDPGSSARAVRAAGERDRVARFRDELEMVLSAAGIGQCCIDRQWRVVRADPNFRSLFGSAPDAPLSWQALEHSIVQECRKPLQEAIEAAFDQGSAVGVTLRTLAAAGSSRWIALRGRAPADSRGRRRHLLLAARDCTAEKEATAALELALSAERSARLAAEAANRAKDEFLSVVSHELRSPLNAILGWNRILAIKRADDPEVSAVAPRIEQSARAQLKMVNDLLDLGRIGTGKLRIAAREMRLAPIVRSAVDALRPAALAKGLQITLDIHELPGPVRADPERLTQVVSNLLSNAIKFTPSGGHIIVCLRESRGTATLSVSDTGQGIAADLLPHIFDRFRQGDSSTTRGSGGLGLGLTLVREIVALHGGQVAATSEGPGRGSTFLVSLPLMPAGAARAEDERRPPRGARETQLAGLSILVVDDEADARAVVAEALRLEGARVTVGDSAQAALAHLQTPGTSYDVVVTDIGMPEEDGYSLVRKLRAFPAGERVIAIALTGYASRADIEAAIDAGFDLHVPKPVDFDSFVPIIRRLAGSR